MKVALMEMLEKLGVGHEMSPYETNPWFYYDEEKGITCSAEVRIGPDYDDLEAELQFLYDVFPPEGMELPEDDAAKKAAQASRISASAMYDDENYGNSDDDDEDGGDDGSYKGPRTNPEIIIKMRAEPVKDGLWSPKQLWVRGEDYVNKVGNWEEKGCAFFLACVLAMLREELPKIEDLIEQELADDDMFGGGGRGRIGRKSPKMKAEQVLGISKRGM